MEELGFGECIYLVGGMEVIVIILVGLVSLAWAAGHYDTKNEVLVDDREYRREWKDIW